MWRSGSLLLACGIAGLVGGILGGALVGSDLREPSTAPTEDVRARARLDGVAPPAVDEEARVRLDALERNRSGPARPTELAALVRAIERLTARLDRLEKSEPSRAARPRRKAPVDHEAERRKWAAVLERTDLPKEERETALSRLGRSLRALKRHVEEAEVFANLAEFAGPDTWRGAQALYDLSWTRWYQQDIPGACDVMESCAVAPGTPHSTRLAALFHAADWAVTLEQPERARALAANLLLQCSARNGQSERRFASQAQAILQKLR